MFGVVADTVIKGVVYATSSSIMWVWYWMFPSRQDRNSDEMREMLVIIKKNNSELDKKITNIKHMLNNEQNIPEVVNMTEYINVLNTLEDVTASKIVPNGSDKPDP